MNRRTFELVILTVILVEAAKAIPRLWARKAMATSQPGSLQHTVAEDATLTLAN